MAGATAGDSWRAVRYASAGADDCLADAGDAHDPRTARLAAWTVAKQANGDIKVTVRQLSDPSGLQSTLRVTRSDRRTLAVRARRAVGGRPNAKPTADTGRGPRSGPP
jgi:hypothetical protein